MRAESDVVSTAAGLGDGEIDLKKALLFLTCAQSSAKNAHRAIIGERAYKFRKDPVAAAMVVS